MRSCRQHHRNFKLLVLNKKISEYDSMALIRRSTSCQIEEDELCLHYSQYFFASSLSAALIAVSVFSTQLKVVTTCLLLSLSLTVLFSARL